MTDRNTSPISLPFIGKLDRKRFIALFKFAASGLPSFLIAIPLNVLLVEQAGIGEGTAYALVIAFQVTVNFFVCRYVAFNRKDGKSLLAEFGVFFSGIMLFRVADWGLYYVIVKIVGFPKYVLVQIINVFIFAVLKFLFSEKIFLRHSPTPPKHAEAEKPGAVAENR